MNELASWLWPIPIAAGAWLAGWLACDWRNGRHRRQEDYRLRLAKDKAYLREPCKLWEESVERAVQIPTYRSLGRPRTTARRTRGASSAVQEAARMSVPIVPFSRSAPLTMPIIPAGQHSPFAVRQDVLPDGEKTPVSDAPETG